MDFCNDLNHNFTVAQYNNVENVKFTSLVSPLLQMIQHKLSGNYMYAEGYLIKSLKQNKTMSQMTGSDILDLSRHMSACLAHAYLIILMMLLSILIGYPLICCFNACNRKISDPNKYPYQMCIQSVLLFTSMCFLLVGAGSSWHAGFEMQTALEVLPSAARNAVNNIDVAVNALKIDGIWFNNTLTEQLELMKSSNRRLPKVVKIFEKTVNTNYKICSKKILTAIVGIYDVFNTLERVRTRNHLKAFMETYEYIRSNAVKQKLALPKLELKILVNRTLFFAVNDINLLSGVMMEWNRDRRYIDAVDRTTPFRARIERDVLDITADNTQAIKQFEEQLRNVSKFVTGVLVGVGSSMSEQVLSSIENASIRINGIVKGTYLSRDTPSRYYKISAYILLLPSTLGFVVFAFFVLGFVRSFKDIQNSSIGKLADCKSLLFFKLAINLSIPFLWLILFGAAVLYCIHVPAAIFCGLVSNNQILTGYFDQPLWNNTTFMTNKLNEITPVNLNIRIADVLKTCRNGSVYNHTTLQELTTAMLNYDRLINANMHKVLSIFQNIDFFNYYKMDTVYGLMNSVNETLSDKVLAQAYFNLNETSKTLSITRDILENRTGLLYRKELRHLKFNVDEMKKDLTGIVKIKTLLIDKVVENFQQFNESVILWTLNYDNRHIGHVHRFLVSLKMECITQQMKSVAETVLFGKIGNCTFLPDTYYKINHIICDYALVVLNTLWLSLVILSGSILVASILSCKLAQYIRGAIRNQQLQTLELQRYSSVQSQASSEMPPEYPILPPEEKQTTF